MKRSTTAGGLSATVIRFAMGTAAERLTDLEVVAETGSTNTDLLERPAGRVHRHALIADRQSGGRGRRGRIWHSPPGCNLYLSLGWRFSMAPGGLAFLPLVVAVAVARSLDALGLRGHGIKWPNDLLLEGEKLGGCLVELRPGGDGGCRAVLGIGLNVDRHGASGLDAIDQPWTDLASRLPDVDRNQAAAVLLASLLSHLDRFETADGGAAGFEPFRADWARYDLLNAQAVRIEAAGGEARGIARGLGPGGGLLVECDGERVEVHSGEVRVRPAPS